MSKMILVLLATSLVAIQAPTCEAFIFDLNFMSNTLTVKDFFQTGIDLIEWITQKTDEPEVKEDTTKLLDQISKNLDEMKSALKGNFTTIIGRIENISSIVWEQGIKGSFKDIVDKIGDHFKSLTKKQIQSNKHISWIGYSEATIVANYETNLESNWQTFRRYLFDGNIINYLKMQGSNNVCETGISQLQLLEKSLNQYMTVASQYMFSQHIIYNIREYLDAKNYGGHRQGFNSALQDELVTDLDQFKRAMRDCSTEYWRCDPAKSLNALNFIPEIKKEKKQGSYDCEDIRKNGYQCIPSNNNRNCDCIKSTMVISLALAKADPGYVITGAQMKIFDQVLRIVAKQAKLLPNGQIDKSTIKLVTKGKLVPGKPAYADFVLKKNTMLYGKIEIPQNRFMTAVGFQKNYEDFYIGAESTRFDFERKALRIDDTRMEYHERSSSPRGTTFARAVDVTNGRPADIKWTDRIFPLIDNQMVESFSPSPLSGIGLFLRGKSEKDGFLAIKINTYNTVPLIPQIPSLNEFPVQEILKSLSNSTSLHELEKKFGTL